MTSHNYGLGAPERHTPIFTPAGSIYLRTSERPPVVRLRASVRAAILKHARSSPHLESGGGLYTDCGPLDEITVDLALGPGRSFRRRRDEIRFDPVELDGAGGHRRLTGLWHSHPGGGVQLSGADLDCFVRTRSERTIVRFVALLASPTSPNSWNLDPACEWLSPALNAWLIGSCSRGDYYERATLVTVPDAPQSKPAPTSNSANSGGAWMVAATTFDVVVDGARETITAGQSYCVAGHELVAKWPDRWRPALNRTAATRCATRLTREPVHVK